MSHSQTFKRAYGQLKGNDQDIAREIMMKRCDWSPQTFCNKKNGHRKVKEGKPGFSVDEKDIVTSTFKGFGLDAWTGEPIAKAEAI